MDLVLIIGGDLQGQQVDDIGIVGFVGGLKGLGDGGADFGQIEVRDLPVPFDDLIHGSTRFL